MEKKKGPAGGKPHTEPFRGQVNARMIPGRRGVARGQEQDFGSALPPGSIGVDVFELARRVRFCLGARRRDPAGVVPGVRHNTFAGWPGMEGIGAFQELEVRCRGAADPRTGYAASLHRIDEAVREEAIPRIEQAFLAGSDPEPVLAGVVAALQERLGESLAAVHWRLSPYHRLVMEPGVTGRALICQQFEFSASHRLHSPDLSAERNREIFGKCNNPTGHGHNYRIEAAVSVDLGAPPQGRLTPPVLERIVDEVVIRRFDHRNLNLDTREFAALNPSVEHIARVCHDLLAAPVARAGGTLERVTVWETDRTSCTYPAG